MALKKFDELIDTKKQRENFINWLIKKTVFTKKDKDNDINWTDPSECSVNLLEILSDKVIYHWEENDYGSSEYTSKNFTFDEFMIAYNSNLIR